VRTILRLLLTALLVWAGLRVWPQLLLILVSILTAITLSPAIAWLEERRLPRALAVVFIGLAFVAVVAAAALLVIPRLSEELSTLLSNLPRYEDSAQRYVPHGHPILSKIVSQVFQLPASPEFLKFLAKPLVWGRVAVEAITGFVLIVVLSLYFAFDGKRLYAWILAYVPRRHRKKIAETAPEVEKVIHAYMLGQLITSLLCGVTTFAVLSLLGVPAAMPLAVLAAVCDVLPVVGIVISTVPAVLVAMTVSPRTALFVLIAFLAYHAVETYVLVPRTYGRQLRLSTLAVLIAIIVGGSLQGVLGAILILPMVAAYPVIERIWLHEYLGPETVSDHRVLTRAAEHGAAEELVDAVLRGEHTGMHPAVPGPPPPKVRKVRRARSA